MISGLTLIEVMIALVVLSLGLTATFGGMNVARQTKVAAENYALALQEIQAQIETYQYLPFQSLQSDFKGASFSVKGLVAPTGYSSVGTITSIYNTTPYSTNVGAANTNTFGTSNSALPLRFKCVWDENGTVRSVEMVYVLVYRGL